MTGNQDSETRLDAEARDVLARHNGRPAWVFSAEGDALIWANDEGLALLLADSMQTAKAAGVAPTAPASRSLRAVARTPVDAGGRGRIEILRINTGGQQETLVATCKPIELAGQRVVLALGSLRNTRSLRPNHVVEPSADVAMESDPLAAAASGVGRAENGQEPARTPSQTAWSARQASRPAGSRAASFNFQQRSRPHRFSFMVNLDGRIANLSSGLADAVGPLKALEDGETASLAVADRALDASPLLIRSLANRQRFGEQTVLWPVSDTYLAVPVRLSGFGEDDGSLRVFGTVLTAKAQTAVASEVDSIAPQDNELEPLPVTQVPAPELEPETDRAPELDGSPAAAAASLDPVALTEAVSAITSGFAAGLARPVPKMKPEPPVQPADPADERDRDEMISAPTPPTVPTPVPAQDEQEASRATPAPPRIFEDNSRLPQVDDAPWGGLTDKSADDHWNDDADNEFSDHAAIAAAEIAKDADQGDVQPEEVDEPVVKTEQPTPDAVELTALTEADPAPESPSETAADKRLSRPERLTFQEIARRLGARITGREEVEDRRADPVPPTVAFSAPTDISDDLETEADDALAGDGSRASEDEPDQISTNNPEEPVADRVDDDESDSIDTLVEAKDFEGEERRTASTPRLTIVDRDTTAQDALRAVEETIGPRPSGRILPFRGTEGAAERQLLDRLPLGLIIYADDKLLYANRTALDMIGLQSVDALRAYSRVENLFEGGMAGRDGAMTLIRLDGSKTRVTGRLQSVRWENQPAALLSIQEARADRAGPAAMPSAAGLVETVTQSGIETPNPDALQIVNAQVAELEAIIDLASDGVVTLDRTGEIKSLNQAAQALVGYGADDLVGRPFRLLFAEDSRQMALDYLEDMASQGKLSLFNEGREVECLTAQGGLVPVFMTLGLLTDDQPPVFCAVLRDLSPFKQAETDLVEARRAAERANAHKSDFLARVSHEIRTPLNAVIGFSEVMLEERFGPVGSERYRQYLRDIHTSGEHLMSLLNDLLDLSKIEAGRMELSFGEVDLNEVVQLCLSMTQSLASQGRIIVRTSLPLTVPKVVADTRSVRQVVVNLLSNAIKFTEPGGQIIVSTLYEPSGEVSLRVRDTGRGMTPADVELALEPFRQVPTTINQVVTGTGLGLPLTKALVEANKAQFSIESTPGEGTLAKVTFPSQRVLAE